MSASVVVEIAAAAAAPISLVLMLLEVMGNPAPLTPRGVDEPDNGPLVANDLNMDEILQTPYRTGATSVRLIKLACCTAAPTPKFLR